MRFLRISIRMCDNCGKWYPKRKVYEDGSVGYTTCCGWGKPVRMWLHIRWPFSWSIWTGKEK